LQTNKGLEISTKKHVVEHKIGEPANTIETLVYIETENNLVKNKVVFYIDKFPYDKTFNLCDEQKTYRYLESVTTYKDGTTKPTYQEKPIECTSSISLTNEQYGTYSLKFFEGYKTGTLNGHSFELPVTSNIQANSEDFKKESEVVGQIAENRWYFEKK
jgi:hypothetical protein